MGLAGSAIVSYVSCEQTKENYGNQVLDKPLKLHILKYSLAYLHIKRQARTIDIMHILLSHWKKKGINLKGK